MSFISDAIDSIKDAVSAVGDIFSDPIGAFGDIFEGALNFLTFGTFELTKDLIGGLFDFEVPFQDRTRMVRAAAGSRQIVYGRAKVGGQLVYIESWFKDRRFITMTVVVAAHQVKEITAIYANGRKVASARSSGNGRMPVVNDGKFNVSGGENRIQCWSADGTQTEAILPTVTPSGNNANPPNWTTDHKLLGQAYVHIFAWYNQDKFESGLPKFEIELKGKNDLLDPRDGSIGYSDNQAICLLDSIRWDRLFGVPDSDIDMDAFASAADVADELVASGVGTTEKRYTVNGALAFDRPPLEIMLSLAKAGAGIPIYSQGRWSYSPGAFSLPEMDLNESDLIGGINFQPGPSKKSRHNKATGTYLDASQDFEELEFPQLQIQAYVDQDLEVLEKSFSFALTTSGTMARRLAKIDIERNRFGLILQVNTKFRTLRLTPGTRVTMSISTLGWNMRVFRVEDLKFSFERGVSLTLREDSPDIYDWEEGDALALDVPPAIQIPDGLEISSPSGITVTEELYQTLTRSAVKVRMIVSWAADDDRVARGYDVQFKESSQAEWVDAATFWQDNEVEINDVNDVTHDIRIRAINTLGKRSGWTQASYTVIGKTAPPSDVTGFIGTTTNKLDGESKTYGIRLEWDDIPDLDLDIYDVRSADSNWGVKTNSQLSRTPDNQVGLPITTAGVYTFYIKAVDTTGNFSANATSAAITIDAPGQPSLSERFEGSNFVLSWTEEEGDFPVDGYEIRREGSDWASATKVDTLKARELKIDADWSGTTIWRVKEIDVAGNFSPEGAITATVTPPAKPPNLASKVIAIDVLLNWDDIQGTLPTAQYRVYRNTDPTAAFTDVGTKRLLSVDGTFAAIKEDTPQDVRYWVTTVDTAGNESDPSTVVVTVEALNDFVVQGRFEDDFTSGITADTFTKLPGINELLGPYDISNTVDDHYAGFSTTDDIINAGFPFVLQPTRVTAGSYQNEYDIGAVLGQTLITVAFDAEVMDGNPSTSVTIESKAAAGDAYTVLTNGTQVLASDVRFIRVTIEVASDSDDDLLSLTNLLVQARIRRLTVEDTVTATATETDAPLGGTKVTLEKTFLDIQSVIASVKGDNSGFTAFADWEDVEDQNTMHLWVYDANGNRATKDVSYSVRGLVG